MTQFGIRCVIARSFGEIFRKNCIPNGLLPIVLDGGAIKKILAQAGEEERLVDLPAQRVIAAEGDGWPFAIGGLDREMLLEGLDAIELTLKHAQAVSAFQARDMQHRPWVYARPDCVGANDMGR